MPVGQVHFQIIRNPNRRWDVGRWGGNEEGIWGSGEGLVVERDRRILVLVHRWCGRGCFLPPPPPTPTLSPATHTHTAFGRFVLILRKNDNEKGNLFTISFSKQPNALSNPRSVVKKAKGEGDEEEIKLIKHMSIDSGRSTERSRLWICTREKRK